jgi:hypothetical protein
MTDVLNLEPYGYRVCDADMDAQRTNGGWLQRKINSQNSTKHQA